MQEDTTPAEQVSTVSPIIRVGEIIIFKFEGNLRAQVIGYEIIGDKVWLDARVCLGFKVPFSQVIAVESEE